MLLGFWFGERRRGKNVSIRDGNWTQARWVPAMGRVNPTFMGMGMGSGNYPQT